MRIFEAEVCATLERLFDLSTEASANRFIGMTSVNEFSVPLQAFLRQVKENERLKSDRDLYIEGLGDELVRNIEDRISSMYDKVTRNKMRGLDRLQSACKNKGAKL